MTARSMCRFILLLVGVAVALAGCSTVDKVMPGKRVDYKKSKTVPTLEIPPDLSEEPPEEQLNVPPPAPTTYSDFASDAARPHPAAGTPAVLPEPDQMHIERDGDQRWLVVPGDPGTVWQRVRDFWTENGFLLTREDPRIGILETAWTENRADIPMDPIRRMLDKVIPGAYSAATRDKYRTRLERGNEPGTTEIFIAHRGMEEVVTGTPDEDTGTVWRPRPNDPELEAEMLRRLMVYLGVEEKKAEQMLVEERAPKPRAQLVADGEDSVMLMVDEGFSQAWRRTGIALDRVGFAVEDRNRSEGVYYVRYNDPLAEDREKSFFSKLAFWRGDEKPADLYRIHLHGEGATTRVVVEDEEGREQASGTARRILTLLEEQLK